MTRLVMLLVLSLLACDRAECEGPLRPEHRLALTLAGWIGFVDAHVECVRYDPPGVLAEVAATGRATCPQGTVDVVTTNRSAIEVTATIVHEAAHVADRCQSGEAPAEEAEAAFLFDLSAAIDAGVLRSPELHVEEVSLPFALEAWVYDPRNGLAACKGEQEGSRVLLVDPGAGTTVEVPLEGGARVDFCGYRSGEVGGFIAKTPLSADGERLVLCASGEGGPRVLFAGRAGVVTSWPVSSTVRAAALSERGSRVALRLEDDDGPRLAVHDVDSGVARPLPAAYRDPGPALAWVSDHTLVVSAKSAGTLEIVDVLTGEAKNVHALGLDELYYDGAWTLPSSPGVVFAGTYGVERRAVYAIGLAGGSDLLATTTGSLSDPALDPRGASLAYFRMPGLQTSGWLGGKLVILDLATGTEREFFDEWVAKTGCAYANDTTLLVSTAVVGEGPPSERLFRVSGF